MGSGPSINQSEYSKIISEEIPNYDDYPRRTENDLGWNAVWSVRPFNSVSPIARTAYISAYDSQNDLAYIGYGVTESKQHLIDLWKLDLKTNCWTEIHLENNKVKPRGGARAVLVGNYLWIYGGYYNKQYLQDLHCINVQTGEVIHPKTYGQGPMACSGHSMNYVNGKIIIYGGYNNGSINQCFMLDLRTMNWKAIETKYGKFSHAAAVFNNTVYTFGGSKNSGMIAIDPTYEDVRELPSEGDAPANYMTRISMVTVGQHIVQIGGSSRNGQQFAPVKVYDTHTHNWFTLPISPDNNTTLVSDGEIDSEGNFNLPVCFDVTVFYREKQREIVAFQGKPIVNPPYLSVLKLPDTLCELNLKNDMVSMLDTN